MILEMRCAIWCYLYNLKNVKNTQLYSMGVFHFFKVCKWYQIAPRTTIILTGLRHLIQNRPAMLDCPTLIYHFPISKLELLRTI